MIGLGYISLGNNNQPPYPEVEAPAHKLATELIQKRDANTFIFLDEPLQDFILKIFRCLMGSL